MAAYHPLRDEISPYPILDQLGDGQQAVLPWFARHDARHALARRPGDRAEPVGRAPARRRTPRRWRRTSCILPLVFADRHGTRIGHGKGHYDRALAHLREAGPVLAIGIGWESQISDDAAAPGRLGRAARCRRDATRMDRLPVKPSWRKPAGILPDPAADPGVVRDRRDRRGEGHGLAMAADGTLLSSSPESCWILPLKPLLRWMETGKWRE